METKFLKQLCEAAGLPGAEEPVKEIVISALKEFTEEITEDALGNVVAHIPGDGPRLLLDAHMDEVGFMVRHINDRGFLRVIPLAALMPRFFTDRGWSCGGESPLW